MLTIIKDNKKYKQMNYSKEEILDLFSCNYKTVFSEEALWFDGKKIKEILGIDSMPHAIIYTPVSNYLFVLFVVQEDDLNENNSWEEDFYKKYATFKTDWENLDLREQLKKYFLQELNNTNLEIGGIIETQPSLIILTNQKNITLINAVKFLPYQDKHIFALKGFCSEDQMYSPNLAHPELFYFEN